MGATAIACPVSAQAPGPVGGRGEIFAGSELETYLRDLQLVGAVPLYPWSVRSFSPGELDRLLPPDSVVHPWAQRYNLASMPARGLTFEVIRPAAGVRLNSGFPYGSNDGPIWAGRGLTLDLQMGFAARYGAVSLTVAPQVFWAQNASFDLMPNDQTGRLTYADGLFPDGIDRPQRFGSGGYAVLDPGQSSLRLDAGPVTVGISTANQYWGPVTEYPMVLGNNAPGFPHGFIGTSHPIDLWLIRVHGRLVYGRLSQSAYSVETEGGGYRFMAGGVGVATVRGVPGLEIGASRFSHSPWPGLSHITLDHFLIPLRSQQAANFAGTFQDNQIASAFMRWVFPRSGVEVYAEYGREDYNLNLRDFVQEPDHDGGHTIGVRKALRRRGQSFLVLRTELQNTQIGILALGRPQTPFYIHSSPVRQGHTERGQILGSEAGLGGAGATVALDAYRPDGRWTVWWSRMLRADQANYTLGGVPGPRALDVLHTLGVERLVFKGRYDVVARVAAVYELNRYFREDAFNLNAAFAIRANVTR